MAPQKGDLPTVGLRQTLWRAGAVQGPARTPKDSSYHQEAYNAYNAWKLIFEFITTWSYRR